MPAWPDAAADLIRRAIAVCPTRAYYYRSRGTAPRAGGRLDRVKNYAQVVSKIGKVAPYSQFGKNAFTVGSISLYFVRDWAILCLNEPPHFVGTDDWTTKALTSASDRLSDSHADAMAILISRWDTRDGESL